MVCVEVRQAGGCGVQAGTERTAGHTAGQTDAGGHWRE